jgi:hypothetical protein
MRFARTIGVALTFAVAAAALTAADVAWAQLRSLPPKAKRAILQGYQNPVVFLGNEQLRLAPGAVIYDTNNRTIVPVSLPAPADVVFTTDQAGAVTRIYLLTPQEIQQLNQSRR